MDWESWLRAAAKPPSEHENEKRNRTEQQIKAALAAYAPLSGRPYRVYVKGSYANNTNVRLNFDVDIAVEYYGYFYYDLEFKLKGQQPGSAVGIVDSEDPYTRAEFKADIRAALIQAFGKQAVSPGRIAFRVREKATTLPADVVPSWEYRRYDGGFPLCHQGTCVFPTGVRERRTFRNSNGRTEISKTNKPGNGTSGWSVR
jgi:hypothetical protein